MSRMMATTATRLEAKNRLPMPVVHKIYVYDTHLEVALNLFIPAVNDHEPVEHLQWIEDNVHFYLAYGMNKNLIDQVVYKEASIFSIFADPNTSIPYTSIPTIDSNSRYEDLDFENYAEYKFDFVGPNNDYVDTWMDKLYGENNSITYQYSTTVTIVYQQPKSSSSGKIIAELDDGYNNLILFSFSSAIDIADPTVVPSPTFIETFDASGQSAGRNPSTNQGHWAPVPRLPPALLMKQTSNILYEPVMENAELTDGLRTGYFDSADLLYAEMPIQSLDGTYYKQQGVTFTTLIAAVENMIGLPASAADIVTMEDNISYVLATYKSDPKILVELNTLRKAFPTRGGGSPMGRLYDSFSNLIMELNRQLKTGTMVRKRQVQNDKVIDYRTQIAQKEYDASQLYGNTAPDNFTAAYSTGDIDQILYPTAYITRQVYKTTTDDDNAELDADAHALNWGYFFCDFERIMRAETALSKVFDVGKVEHLFGGKDLTNQGLALCSVEFMKYDNTMGTLYGTPTEGPTGEANLKTMIHTDYGCGERSEIAQFVAGPKKEQNWGVVDEIDKDSTSWNQKGAIDVLNQQREEESKNSQSNGFIDSVDPAGADQPGRHSVQAGRAGEKTSTPILDKLLNNDSDALNMDTGGSKPGPLKK